MALEDFKKRVAAALAIVSLVGFMVLHITPAIQVLRSLPVPGSFTGTVCIGVCTTISGLVSGIVAGVFGVQAGHPPPPGTTFLRRRLDRLGWMLYPTSAYLSNHQQKLAMAYIIGYFATALLALIAMIYAPGTLPASTASLALFAPGIVVAIVHGYLSSL